MSVASVVPAAAATSLRASGGASTLGATAAVGLSTAVRGCAFMSKEMESAHRLVNPTHAAPATGDAVPLEDKTNPRVEWREHWDHYHRRPFYHNLVSNEVAWEMPLGFPSRFNSYYRVLATEDPTAAAKQGVSVVENPVTGKPVPTSPKESGTVVQTLTLRQKIKQYGGVGFILYGVLHFGWMSVLFVIIWLGLDVTKIVRALGFPLDEQKGKSVTATLVAAVALNKLFVPFQLAGTAYLAPRLAPHMRKFWTRAMNSISS